MAEIEVNGPGTLDDDFMAFQTALAKMVSMTIPDIGADMQDALKQRVKTDVYDAYNPIKYKRRGDDGLGAQAEKAKIYNHGAGLSIEYKPSGEHSHANWHTADADELISRIETKRPPYFKRAQRKVPQRPFWYNFVSEMVDDATAEFYFANAMRRLGEDIIEDKNVIRETGDGDY